jgi:hypothetical protein
MRISLGLCLSLPPFFLLLSSSLSLSHSPLFSFCFVEILYDSINSLQTRTFQRTESGVSFFDVGALLQLFDRLNMYARFEGGRGRWWWWVIGEAAEEVERVAAFARKSVIVAFFFFFFFFFFFILGQ